ncbi:unnamed protein product [Linum tenue]|uniref:Uncharacterized protein n=1 Tax=Linum tenue TaxID=586396 RepID=A0AAV0I9C4_9ROSI|nr:unnamed protein product [Linum tenue]
MLRRNPQFGAPGEPLAQRLLPPPADDEHDVPGVVAEPVQDGDDLVAGGLVDGRLWGHGAVVVQQDEPAGRRRGLPVGCQDRLDLELPEARAQGDDPEPETEPDPPVPLVVVVPAGPLEVLVEAPRPVGHVVGADVLVVLLVAHRLLVVLHRDRLRHRDRDRLDVPRVHPDRPAERRGAPDELRNDQDALLLLLNLVTVKNRAPLPTNSVLVRNQIHTVPDAIHYAAFCNCVVSSLLHSCQSSTIDEHNRTVTLCCFAKPPIHRIRHRIDLVLHFSDVFPFAPCWVANLDKNNSASQIRILLQQSPHCEKLEADPFEDVQIVDPNNQGLPLVLVSQLLHLLHDLAAVEMRFELAHVNPHWQDFDAHSSPKILQSDIPSLRFVIQPQHSAAAGQEMAGVIESVEPYQIAIEQSPKNLLPHGNRPVDFR